MEGMQMFFVAIVLPEELNKRILVYKQRMKEQYGCKVGLKSPAHITLLPPYWMEGDKEAFLLSDVDAISNGIPPFSISTNNFSSFKPRTIFIDVIVDERLAAVKKQADEWFKNQTAYQVKVDSRPFHPHITIATRDLFKKDYYEAWPYYEQQEFKETWIADGLSVLKHNGRTWEVVHVGRFKEK